MKAHWVGVVLVAVLGGCAGSPQAPPLPTAAIGAVSPLAPGRVLAVVVRSPRSSAELEAALRPCRPKVVGELEAVDWAVLQVREAREGVLARIRGHCQLVSAETVHWQFVSLQKRAQPSESLSEAEREVMENLPGTLGYVDDER